MNNNRGVFETIRVHRGKLEFLEEHVERLTRGARHIGLEAPDLSEAQGWVTADEGVLRVTVTAGGTQWSFGPPRYRESDLAAGWIVGVSTIRLPRRPHARFMKSTDRVLYDRARSETPGADEAVLLDADGNVAEGSRTNLFWVADETLFTAPGDCGILEGIIRAQVIACAEREGIPITETLRPPEALFEADEVFVCNSLIGVTPVRRVGDREITKGPLTTKLRNGIWTRIE